MTGINLHAIAEELRRSAAEAQDRANRHAVNNEPDKAARADETAELLRALLRAVNAGTR